jgi:hypothetical protein
MFSHRGIFESLYVVNNQIEKKLKTHEYIHSYKSFKSTYIQMDTTNYKTEIDTNDIHSFILNENVSRETILKTILNYCPQHAPKEFRTFLKQHNQKCYSCFKTKMKPNPLN